MGLALSDAAKKTAGFFFVHDVQGMRKLHDALLESVALEYDEALYRLALITYVLSKILSKPRYWREKRSSKYWSQVKKRLENCSMLADGGKNAQALRQLVMVHQHVTDAEERDRRFISGLFSKAAVKAASTFYAKGLSLGRSAELTGIDKREILSYAGTTAMNERLEGGVDIRERMRRLRAMFG